MIYNQKKTRRTAMNKYKPRTTSDWRREVNKVLGIKERPAIPLEDQIKKLEAELEKERQLRLFYMRMAEEEKKQKNYYMTFAKQLGDMNG